MITFKNIKKLYGDQVVLDIEDWTINEGDVLGLVGNNGAGKTTAFSVLLDLIKPNAGIVTSKNVDVSNSEEWKRYTASYLDDSFLIDFLTPNEYFEFIGKLCGLSLSQTMGFVREYEAFFNDEIIDQKKYLRDLSKGNQKKVGLIAALIGNPELVILDEPFSNLDPTSQNRLKNIIKAASKDRTILISSHDLNHVMEVCDRIVLLEKGKLIRDLHTNEGTIQEIQEYFAVD